MRPTPSRLERIRRVCVVPGRVRGQVCTPRVAAGLGFVNVIVRFTRSRLFIATDYKSKCPLNFRELYILLTSLPLV